jgi:Methyltransferase domain
MNLQEGLAKKSLRILRATAPIMDWLLLPFTILAAGWFRIVRFWGVRRMPATKTVFLKLGVFPIVNHYYEPLFDYRQANRKTRKSFLDFNEAGQLDFLTKLKFDNELSAVLAAQQGEWKYVFNNGSFEDKDARVYYSLIRHNKPSRILEVGSGYSTLIALAGTQKNSQEDSLQTCELTCIEPYEMPRLEKLPIKLIRQKIEDIDPVVFSSLNENDILFIDSSHIIRPGGDVTYLFLSVIPLLKKGVWIHVHDIFLPEDYPISWLRDEFRMWNEQYLLEALLIGNHDFEIMCALNYLYTTHPDKLLAAFPGSANNVEKKPGSFWIRKK